MSRQTFFVGVFALTLSGGAAAYLDPGTGSMILQGLIAGVALAWFTIKTYWYKLAALFGKKPPSSLLEDDAAADNGDSKE